MKNFQQFLLQFVGIFGLAVFIPFDAPCFFGEISAFSEKKAGTLLLKICTQTRNKFVELL